MGGLFCLTIAIIRMNRALGTGRARGGRALLAFKQLDFIWKRVKRTFICTERVYCFSKYGFNNFDNRKSSVVSVLHTNKNAICLFFTSIRILRIVKGISNKA